MFQPKASGSKWLWIVLLALGLAVCVPHPQRYQDFTTSTPLEEGQFLVLGFVGGRESWDNPDQGVRRLALQLRARGLPAAVETVENQKRELAIRLIWDAFDRDQNGHLDQAEKCEVRLILYGHSFGGAAVVKLARQLEKQQIPVRLTIQIDSVGAGDKVIPPNVRRAANLYQKNGMFIKGEAPIRARDPGRTEILGNHLFDYSDSSIGLSGISWHEKIFRVAHARMGLDPTVWQLVERLILEELRRQSPPGNGS